MTPRDDTQANDMTQPQTDKLDDHHRQQLSAMLDGELLPDQAKFMLRRLEHDGELVACWERWQVCGGILRGRHEALLPADFPRRVADAIAGQDRVAATAAAPAAAKHHPRWARWGGGAALAASVAMVALFVGRQATGPEVGPAAQEQVRMVAGTSAPQAAPAPVPAMPDPAPAAPVQAPDAATTLAAAVAVAEVPRRAAERRASSSQQRVAARNRRAAQAPAQVAAAGRAVPDSLAAPATILVAGAADANASAAAVAGLFSAEPAHPRPWPRAILPGFQAPDAFAASYGDVAAEPHPFHPFEPRVELQPAPAEPRGASGPR